ncbi:TonB-dependent receptor [Parapedobacter defluvii]|nr:TonB-dependent receptor [Parapedobacter defluvii]
MKWTGVLLMALFCQLAMAAYSQRITVRFEGASLKTVISYISEESGYTFLYDQRYLGQANPVSLNMQDKPVLEVVKQAFAQQPFVYQVVDQVITIRPKPAGETGNDQPALPHPVQDTDVKGKVTDSLGIPLAGVSVRVKGTDKGTTTDNDGNFVLQNVADGAVLTISFIGSSPQEIPVSRSEMHVVLQNVASSLNEVVVIGYGTQRKIDLTGAVSSVKADDIVMSQGPEIGNMLKGKVAGLTIQQNSAQPGGGIDILIRGAGSVNASNAPLFVVDGFPISDLQQPAAGNRYDGGTQSILNSFNPNDIESIEVLKDASATSIYGARAANGVVLITTKRGKEGKARVDYSGNFSFQTYDNSFDVLPLNEWMAVSNESSFDQWMWDNQVYPYGERTLEEAQAQPVNDIPYRRPFTQHAIDNVGRGTDWFDLVMRNGSTQQHNLSMSGGNSNTKYLISGNYYDQNGVVKNVGFKRYSVRANIDQDISKYVKVGLNFTGSRIGNDNTQLGGEEYENSGIIRMALQMGPQIQEKDENGNYLLNPKAPLQPNPASMLTISDEGRVERMLLNTFADITPIKDLTIRLKAGLDRGVTKRNTYLPKTTIHGALENGRASISNFDRDDYLLEGTINYTKTLEDGHKFDVLGGVSRQKFYERSESSAASGFITDAFLWNNLNAGSTQLPSTSYSSENMIASYFGRLNYNYKSKYLVTLTLRTDGASVFARNNKWATFPSAAVAWNVAEEPFFEHIKGTFTQLKVRLSYGQTGNAAIGGNAFAAYSAYPGWLSSDDTRMMAVSLSRLENPDLKWETTTGLNLGLDYALFNGKIEGSVELFNNQISDLLQIKPLNSYQEVNEVWANVGKTRSRGVEVSVTTRNIQRKDFQWRTIANFSMYRDTWLERAPDWKPSVFENANDPLRPMHYRIADGILQIGEDIPVSQPLLRPGQIKIKDIDGFARDESGNPVVDENGVFLRTGQPDGMIDEADNVLLGTSDPGYMIGLTNIISYKNFSLNFDFNGLLGRRMADPNYVNYGYSAWGTAVQGYNSLRTVKDRWTPTNPSTTNPSTFANYSTYGYGDFFLQDAWFIRLQNVSLGYKLPKEWINGVFSSVQINVAANNIFVISPYTGIDPETDSYTAAYPNIRTFTAGLNLVF